MSRVYKIAFWGPGHIGGTALREALQRPEFEVVAVKVYSPQKHGLDIGELVGLPPVGVLATTDRDEVLAADADCVVFTPRPLDAEANNRDAFDLLASGKNVVTTWNFHYAPMRGQKLVDDLAEACERGGSSVQGTGIHPSFMVERVVLTLTGLMLDVDRIRFVEAVDVSKALVATGPEIVGSLGFGRDPSSFGPADPGYNLAGVYYEDVIGFVGKALFDADPTDIRIEHDFSGSVRDEDVHLPGLTIPAGTASALSHVQRGYIGDHHFFTNEEHWYLGPENRHLGSGTVPFGGFAGSSNYVVEIDGKPGSIAMQLDLESTVGGDIPIITWGSVVTLLQAVIPTVHALPGVIHANSSPHFQKDMRQNISSRYATVR